ncbi:MAG: hypothetical protein M1828_001882 [Chrysothrix sp. TS-e1954]|nr:MAG: hypothetical protein M1828_001882 [Chrysothrix sp. TS-e1954]
MSAGDNTVKTTSEAAPPTSDESSQSSKPQRAEDGGPSRLQSVVSILTWMPPWCRWTPGKPPSFSLPLNLLFAFAGTFTVANLYYNHPILNILANDFGVSYLTISRIPSLMQAGYALGLLTLCPLGDLFKRRHFVLTLVLFTATLWIGLCITNNFVAFSALSFLTAISTVTPQLMLPLVGELAPPHRRAAALSIVVSGNLLGILIARILSGVVTHYTSWRNIYWLALGLQYFIFILLWLFMPDYPSTNPGGLNYFKMLWSILAICKRQPVLMQASLISFCTSACFTSFWTTLTFLLAGAPYHYNSVVIGLFALIGIAAMCLGPVYARLFIQKFVPIFSTILGECINLVCILIGTYSGRHTVAGPIIMALGLDAGMQISQIANRSAIYAIEPTARNRVNTAFMVFTFLGQLTGTSAGNKLYSEAGWVASGSLSVGFMVFALFLCALRGPYEEGWIGWHGGWSIYKRNQQSADGKTVEKATAVSGSSDMKQAANKDEEQGVQDAASAINEKRDIPHDSDGTHAMDSKNNNDSEVEKQHEDRS